MSVLALGCTYADGELEVDRVSVERRPGGLAEVAVELYNPGATAVWARSNLPALYEEDETLVVALHDDTPGGPTVGSEEEPSLDFLKVAGQTDFFDADGKSTLRIMLPEDLLNRENVRVELGWHRRDPGSPAPEAAPAPEDLAQGEWEGPL